MQAPTNRKLSSFMSKVVQEVRRMYVDLWVQSILVYNQILIDIGQAESFHTECAGTHFLEAKLPTVFVPCQIPSLPTPGAAAYHNLHRIKCPEKKPPSLRLEPGSVNFITMYLSRKDKRKADATPSSQKIWIFTWFHYFNFNRLLQATSSSSSGTVRNRCRDQRLELSDATEGKLSLGVLVETGSQPAGFGHTGCGTGTGRGTGCGGGAIGCGAGAGAGRATWGEGERNTCNLPSIWLNPQNLIQAGTNARKLVAARPYFDVELNKDHISRGPSHVRFLIGSQHVKARSLPNGMSRSSHANSIWKPEWPERQYAKYRYIMAAIAQRKNIQL